MTKSATFRQSASGKWYASVVVEWECEEGPLPLPEDADRVSGIDLGLITYAVLSSGEKVPTPRFGRVGDRTIRRLNQKLARQVKGSNSRARTKRRLALAHERIANQRRDFVHQLTTQLLDDHDGVCIEDLAVSGLARTKLARSVLDAAWGEDPPPEGRVRESRAQDPGMLRIAQEVVAVAREAGCTPTQVAVSWVRSRPGVVIPLVGARTLEQVKDNLDALHVKLDREHLARLDEASAIDLGFPHEFLERPHIRKLIYAGTRDLIDDHRTR